MDNVDMLVALTQYGIAGVALYLLYRIANGRLMAIEHELRETKEEIRLLRSELLESTRGREKR